jgi:hypothetical protein
MVSNLDMVLQEIEFLRNRMHDLYRQTRSLRNHNLVRISKQLDRKLNNHQKLLRLK